MSTIFKNVWYYSILLTEIGQNKMFIIKAQADTDLELYIENSGHVQLHSSYKNMKNVLKETMFCVNGCL